MQKAAIRLFYPLYASARTLLLRAMKSDNAFPFRRPLASKARSVTCYRASLPEAYSSTLSLFSFIPSTILAINGFWRFAVMLKDSGISP